MSIPLKAKMRQRALKREIRAFLWEGHLSTVWKHKKTARRKADRPTQARLVRAAASAQAIFVYLYNIIGLCNML